MMTQITAQELRTRLDQGEELMLIDVREPYEHDEFNIGGTLIPLAELPTRLDELEKAKSRDIVVYCRSGNRSALAQHVLGQAGFSNVLNLQGGVLAWQEMENSQQG